MTITIAPSILGADFAKLGDEIAMCEAGGADWIHIDVMDGRFVPNLTFGAKVIETVRRLTSLPLDVHLMVVEPETLLRRFRVGRRERLDDSRRSDAASASPAQPRAGARLSCRGRTESGHAAHRRVRDRARDRSAVDHDGEPWLRRTAIHRLHARQGPSRADDARRRRAATAALEVDGGVSRDTIQSLWEAGADTFVAGNAIFSASDPRAEIGVLRSKCGVAV